jgi:hypothetical protein
MWMKVDLFHKDLGKCIFKNVVSSNLNLCTTVEIKMAMFLLKNVKHVCENFSSDSKWVALRTILKNFWR